MDTAAGLKAEWSRSKWDHPKHMGDPNTPLGLLWDPLIAGSVFLATPGVIPAWNAGNSISKSHLAPSAQWGTQPAHLNLHFLIQGWREPRACKTPWNGSGMERTLKDLP